MQLKSTVFVPLARTMFERLKGVETGCQTGRLTMGFCAAGFDSAVSVEAAQPLKVRKSIRSGADAVARSAFRLFAATLFLALCLAGTVRAAEAADRSALEDYAIWANRALKLLPRASSCWSRWHGGWSN
jgi:hypothetical protein